MKFYLSVKYSKKVSFHVNVQKGLNKRDSHQATLQNSFISKAEIGCIRYNNKMIQ